MQCLKNTNFMVKSGMETENVHEVAIIIAEESLIDQYFVLVSMMQS